jgi:hypothetical protein
MDETLVSFHVVVSPGDGAPDDEIDLTAHRLRSELLEVGVTSVELAAGNERPTGAKGSTGTILGDLAVAVLPALLPKLIDLLIEWRKRASSRSVKVRAEIDGQTVEVALEGQDAAATFAAVERLRSSGKLRSFPTR